MKAYYCDHFVLPLPDGHRFPMSKYALLRQQVVESGLLTSENLRVPAGATDTQILRAHTSEYLQKVKTGSFTIKEIRRLGFPWSLELVERSRRSSGGTISACRTALQDGISVNLAGGTHHAGSNHGEGFCVFNDSAIASLAMQAEENISRIAIIDCDVHQGNGTAEILVNHPSIFTFSIHGEKNFPFRKVAGNLDIGLADNTQDQDYLDTLEIALERILYLHQPELVIYQSGADPFVHDRLGKLALTKQGLAQRDRLVLRLCHAADIPIAITMGGGYAKDVTDIVEIHFQTIKIATELSKKYAVR